MSKKNLDNLFREKFEGFEDIPHERVWQAIETSLDKKSKKRIIPLWWKLGGVAAVMVLALAVFGPSSTSEKAFPSVTDTENLDSVDNEEQQGTPSIFNEEDAVAEEQISETTKQQRDKLEASKNQRSIATEYQNHQETSIESLETTDANNKAASSSKDQLAQSDKRSFRTTDTSTVVQKSNVSNKASGKTSNSPLPEQALANREENSINQKTHNAESSVSKTEITENDLEETFSDNKKSLFEEIEEQNEAEEEIVENTQNRWSVGPNVAPVYFDAMGEGSPIHSAFDQNAKSGNTNLSYGLSVAYEVNKKLKVRSGVHKVNYGYSTNDVAFTSTLEVNSSEKIKNIDYTPTAKNLIVDSETATFSSLSSPLNELALEVSNTNEPARTGAMSQHLGYLEVPLELDYALIDRKFGLNLVGGFSSLFLLDNSVTLNSGDLTTEVGEANNINNVNFSTNVGFGVNYKFTPMIQLNVEPVFKYQLNTFSEVSGDFRPFTLGVYSGLNFKF